MFGNLVTPAWWSDIWLNEAFATWLATRLAPSLDPETPALRAFEFRDDVLATNRADLIAIRPSGELTSSSLAPYFASWHGAALVRMLESYVGTDVFRAAVLDHLSRHAGSTATTTDLVATIDRFASTDLRAVIDDFLDRPRPPSLSYRLDCRGDHSTLRLWFAKQGDWHVPVCFAYDSDGTRAEDCVILRDPVHEYSLAGHSCARWALPDVGATGLYRLAETPAQLLALIDVGWPALSVDERASLFSTPGPIDIGTLPVVGHLVATNDPEAVLVAARIIDAFLADVPDDVRPVLDPWIVQHFAAAAHALHFKSNPDQRALLRITGAARDRAVLAEAVTLVGHEQDLDPHARALVEGLAMVGDPTLVARLFERARASGDSTTLAVALLRYVPTHLAIFERQPALLELFAPYEREGLLETCDPTSHARAVTVAKTALDAEWQQRLEDNFAACLERRTRSEPALRAWVKSLSAVAP